MSKNKNIGIFFSLFLTLFLFASSSKAQQQPAASVPLVPRLQINVPTVSFSQPAAEAGYLNLLFLAEYIIGLSKYLVAIAGVLAGIMVTIGGVQYLLAAGNKSAIDVALKRIKGALIGLALALGSYLILFTINPELVNLRSLVLTPVPTSQLAFSSEGNSADSENNSTLSAGSIPGDSNEYKQFASNITESLGLNKCFFIAQITMESRWNPSVGTGCCHGLGQISVSNARTQLRNNLSAIKRLHPDGCPNCPSPDADKQTIVGWLKSDWKSNLIMSAFLKKSLSSSLRHPMAVIGSYGYGIGTQNNYIQNSCRTFTRRSEDEVAAQILSGQTNQIIQEACIVPDTWPLAKQGLNCPGGGLCCKPGSSPCARPDASPEGRIGTCQGGSRNGQRCAAGAGTQTYIRSFINLAKNCLRQ